LICAGLVRLFFTLIIDPRAYALKRGYGSNLTNPAQPQLCTSVKLAVLGLINFGDLVYDL